MRLNRGTAIFIAIIVIIIVISAIFLNDDDDSTPAGIPTVPATAETVQLFPSVSETNIQSITISAQVEVGDTRPTPIPGNPTLEPLTPLPDGVDAPMTSETLTLTRNDLGEWVVSEGTNASPTDTLDSASLDQSLLTLVTLRSNQQFTPSDGNYEQYGLDNPTYDISFEEVPVAATGVSTEGTPTETSASTNTYRLRLGNQTVGENAYYAFLNDDSETVYIITNANALESSVLNLPTNVPLQALPTPTAAPILNVPGAPFGDFLLTEATGFTFTNNATGDVVELGRSADNTTWLYTQNGSVLDINDPQLQVILNSFSFIQGVQRTPNADLAALGLDSPSYTLVARTINGERRLRLGGQDPTGTIYYGLVDQFEDVVLIDETSVLAFIDIFENPPVLVMPEATAEMTAEATSEPMVEMTPEATEAMMEMTDEAMEVTAEPMAEMTEDSMEMTEEAMSSEPTEEVMAEMTEAAVIALPALEARYNANMFALVNLSEETIDTSTLSIMDSEQAFGDELEAAECILFGTVAAFGQVTPDEFDCDASLRILADDAAFWVAQDETFDIVLNEMVVATCDVASDDEMLTCELITANG